MEHAQGMTLAVAVVVITEPLARTMIVTALLPQAQVSAVLMERASLLILARVAVDILELSVKHTIALELILSQPLFVLHTVLAQQQIHVNAQVTGSVIHAMLPLVTG